MNGVESARCRNGSFLSRPAVLCWRRASSPAGAKAPIARRTGPRRSQCRPGAKPLRQNQRSMKPDQRWIFWRLVPSGTSIARAWSFPLPAKASANTARNTRTRGEASPSSRTARAARWAPPPQPCGSHGTGKRARQPSWPACMAAPRARSWRCGSTGGPSGTPNSNPAGSRRRWPCRPTCWSRARTPWRSLPARKAPSFNPSKSPPARCRRGWASPGRPTRRSREFRLRARSAKP